MFYKSKHINSFFWTSLPSFTVCVVQNCLKWLLTNSCHDCSDLALCSFPSLWIRFGLPMCLIKFTGDNVLEIVSSGLERPWSSHPSEIQIAWIKVQSKPQKWGVMKQVKEGREYGDGEGERDKERLGPHEPHVILKRLYVEQKNHSAKPRQSKEL